MITIRPRFEEDALDEFPGTEFHFVGHRGPLRAPDRLRAMRYIADVIRRLQPDVVHSHSGTAALAAGGLRAAPKARWILDVHDAPGRGRSSRATEWLEGQLSRNARSVAVAHSRAVRDELLSSYRLASEHIELIPLGIDVAAYGTPTTPRDHWRSKNHLRSNAVVALYVARLVPSKNVDLFLDVARSVTTDGSDPPAQFVVLGGGPDLWRFQERAERLGLGDAVRFLGPRPHADLVDALHGSDLFVSTSDYEGFGLAVAEAMAAGRPVVATAVGGHFDLVDEGYTGLLAPVGDVEGLTKGVGALVEDADERARMGSAAAEKARNEFDVETMVGRYEELYTRLACGTPIRKSSRVPRRTDIVVLKSHDYSAWVRDRGPDAGLPYGIDALASASFTLHWTDVVHRPPLTWPRVRAAVRSVERLGAPFVQTLVNLPLIARSPLTLAMFESEGNFLAWARWAGIPFTRRTRLAIVTSWLSEILPRFSASKQRWYRRAYAHVDRIFFFSSNQRSILAEHLGLPDERLVFVPFGVDHHYYSPPRRPSPADGPLLVVGRDRGRDWKTTFAALGALNHPAVVLCRPRDIVGQTVPANVTIAGYVDRYTYRAHLAQAAAVLVITRPVAYPSGQTVMLEAMAMGACVIASATPALTDYLEPDTNALTVPPGDPSALATTIETALADPDRRREIGARARDIATRRFTAERMWREIGRELRSLLDE